jgi:hypothetical protein
LLKDAKTYEQRSTIFRFIFPDTPHYDEIESGTPSMYSIFALQKEKISYHDSVVAYDSL